MGVLVGNLVQEFGTGGKRSARCRSANDRFPPLPTIASPHQPCSASSRIFDRLDSETFAGHASTIVSRLLFVDGKLPTGSVAIPRYRRCLVVKCSCFAWGKRNMRICGVQISGSTANLAVVSVDDTGEITYHPCHTKKITLEDEKCGESLRAFLKAITAFAHENQVEGFCIKQRASGGRLGAGGPSFKVEAMVQMVPDVPTYYANPVALSKFAKTNVAGLPNGLQNYLADAYRSGAFQLKKLGAV